MKHVILYYRRQQFNRPRRDTTFIATAIDLRGLKYHTQIHIPHTSRIHPTHAHTQRLEQTLIGLHCSGCE